MRVLVDADAILEMLLNRQQFAPEAEQLWQVLQLWPFQGYVSAVGLARIQGLVSCLWDFAIADEITTSLQTFLTLCPVDNTMRDAVRASPIPDLESAVEVACAQAMDIAAIVTQRPQDFLGAGLHILSVRDVLKRQQLQTLLNASPDPLLIVGELSALRSPAEWLACFTQPDDGDSTRTSPTDLSQWRRGLFPEEWQALDPLANLPESGLYFRGTYGLASEPNLDVVRAKILKLGSSVSAKQLSLQVGCAADQDPKSMDIWVTVAAMDRKPYLPQGLEVTILDEKGTTAMQAEAKQTEKMRLNFSSPVGVLFNVCLTLGKHQVVESFVV